MSEVICLINLKGGVGKTVSSINIAYSFAKLGKKVLIIDTDCQGNIAKALGKNYDDNPNTIVTLMTEAIEGEVTKQRVRECIYNVGIVGILPSNFLLAGIDYRLMNAFNRECVLRAIVDTVREDYDYIVIDCPPNLGLMVTNALTASNSVLIPVEAHYLSFESLKVMLGTVEMVKKKLNPDLKIAGVFLTMYQQRTKLSQGIEAKLFEIYGAEINVFGDTIPYSIKAAEQPLYGKSLIELAPKHPVSVAYMNIAKELVANGKQ